MKNAMELVIPCRPENEAFARVVVAAFLVRVNPTLEQIEEVKTAVSEAVTNAVVHAYPESRHGLVRLSCSLTHDGLFELTVSDDGVGIPDILRAMEPLFTTRPDEERAGMGFALMRAFMDELKVTSRPGQGTTVMMTKRIEVVVEAAVC